MANKTLADLTALNTTSVTDNSSIFYWVNDGGNKYIAGDVLASALGFPIATTVVRTSAIGINSTTATVVPFELAINDPLGMWSINTPGSIIAPYQGFYQAIGSIREIRVDASATTRLDLKRYDATGTLNPHITRSQMRNDINPEYPCISPPMYLNSGDYIQFEFTRLTVSTTLDGASSYRTWATVMPLALHVGST